jgi:hypothetical protein
MKTITITRAEFAVLSPHTKIVDGVDVLTLPASHPALRGHPAWQPPPQYDPQQQFECGTCGDEDRTN